MPLPNNYTLKPNSIASYFDAILNAEAPERFSYAFLSDLGFEGTNDRLLIGILKELGFLNSDGAPQDRYHAFLDRSRSQKVLAEGIRDAYSDLFSVNKDANKLKSEEVHNKLRTLYKGSKKDGLIARIARTFEALCEQADFSTPSKHKPKRDGSPSKEEKKEGEPVRNENQEGERGKAVSLDSLQYHINIVLPDSRDQAVYDAIFKSLREHLG